MSAFALFRALEFGRAFVNHIYRRRANWIAALLFIITLSNVIILFPALSNSVEGGLVFYALIIVILAFIDGAVLVARETDFFHRDMLGWMRIRLSLYVIVTASVAAEVISFFAIPNFQLTPPPGAPAFLLIAFYQFNVVTPVCFTYAAASIFVGARRTPDVTLKRHVKLLGLSLALFVATFVLFSPGTDLLNLASNALGLLSIYFLYLAVMALSPVAKVEPELASPPSVISPDRGTH